MPFPSLPEPPRLPGHGNASAVVDSIIGALNQRAMLMQRQAQQTAMDQFKVERDLRAKGYTPLMQTTSQEPSGLKRREAQQVDPSRIIRDPWGRQFVAPAAKPDVNPQQAYTDLKGALEQGAAVSAGGTIRDPSDATPRFNEFGQAIGHGLNIPVPDQARVVTPPGSQQPIYLPTEQEKASRSLNEKLRMEAAMQEARPGTQHIDTEHFSVPVLVDPRTGKATAISLPEGVTHKEKPDKESTYRYVENDAGMLTRVANTGKATPETWMGPSKGWVPSGAAVGLKRRDPDAPRGQSEAQVNAAITRHERLQDEEQRHWGVKQQYFDAAAAVDTAQPGEAVVNPGNGQPVYVNDKNRAGWKKIFADRAKASEERAMGAQRGAAAIRRRFGWGEFEAGQAGGAAPKTATRDEVLAYAQEKNIPEAQAMQEFLAKGWRVTRTARR